MLRDVVYALFFLLVGGMGGFLAFLVYFGYRMRTAEGQKDFFRTLRLPVNARAKVVSPCCPLCAYDWEGNGVGAATMKAWKEMGP